MPTVDQVREALTTVEDPELNMGIVDLGLVYGIDVDGPASENVTVTMTLTSPMCPIGPMFRQMVVDKVEGLEGVKTRPRRYHVLAAVGSAHDGERRRESPARDLVGC